jgi:hypothetical protein
MCFYETMMPIGGVFVERDIEKSCPNDCLLEQTLATEMLSSIRESLDNKLANIQFPATARISS